MKGKTTGFLILYTRSLVRTSHETCVSVTSIVEPGIASPFPTRFGAPSLLISPDPVSPNRGELLVVGDDRDRDRRAVGTGVTHGSLDGLPGPAETAGPDHQKIRRPSRVDQHRRGVSLHRGSLNRYAGRAERRHGRVDDLLPRRDRRMSCRLLDVAIEFGVGGGQNDLERSGPLAGFCHRPPQGRLRIGRTINADHDTAPSDDGAGIRDDDQGYGALMGQGVADRTQKEPGDAAVSPAAHDHQFDVRFLRQPSEGLGRRSLDDLGYDLDVPWGNLPTTSSTWASPSATKSSGNATAYPGALYAMAGTCHAYTATTSAFRSLASSRAHVAAARLPGEESTPTTILPRRSLFCMRNPFSRVYRKESRVFRRRRIRGESPNTDDFDWGTGSRKRRQTETDGIFVRFGTFGLSVVPCSHAINYATMVMKVPCW